MAQKRNITRMNFKNPALHTVARKHLCHKLNSPQVWGEVDWTRCQSLRELAFILMLRILRTAPRIGLLRSTCTSSLDAHAGKSRRYTKVMSEAEASKAAAP
jgi:hypothetical protein